MRYNLIWHPSAQDALARFWIQASDKPAVTDAANDIERWLRLTPEQVGEELDEGPERSFVIKPLGVIYTVHPDDCFVRILEIRLVE